MCNQNALALQNTIYLKTTRSGLFGEFSLIVLNKSCIHNFISNNNCGNNDIAFYLFMVISN